MKKKLMLALFALVVLFPSALKAEVKEASHSNYSTFADMAECKAAFLSGEDITPYQPGHVSRFFNENPVDGRNRVREPLRAYACATGKTVNGRKTVLFPVGLDLRWYADGHGNSTGVPYAMDSCGNPIYEFEYVTTALSPAPVVELAPGPEGPMGPQGPQGPQGPKGDGCRVREVEGKPYIVCDDGTASLLPTRMSRRKKLAIGAGATAAIGSFIYRVGRDLCWW